MSKNNTPMRVWLSRPLLVSLLAVLVIVLVGAAAWSDGPVTPPPMPPVASESVVVTPSSPVPQDDPSIRGFITRITTSAESTEILVEYFPKEVSSSDYRYDKVLVKLDGNTATDSDNGTIVDISTLTVGSTVEVWFSEPSEESYPVLAYGQALRVITSGDLMNGMIGLPRLAVVGSSRSLAGVVEAEWPIRGYDYSTSLTEVLGRMRGAYVTSPAGKPLTLSFSTPPKAVSASWADSQGFYSVKNELPLGENNEIIVPEGVTGEVFIYVSASWERGSMVYGFSVSIVEEN